MRLSNFLSWLLEDQANRGLGGPPNNWRSLTVPADRKWAGDAAKEHYDICFQSDAGEIWIAAKYPDQSESTWLIFMNASTFRKMALWYIWRWAWGEWFGLRRSLFYWHLHRRVESYRARYPGY